MKRNRIRTTNWIALFVIGLATAVFAHDPKGKADPMNASLEALKGTEFEESFLQQMIQHHRGGIEMAKLANVPCISPISPIMPEHADVRQCFFCHQTTSWNDIKGVGYYKHH